MIIGSVSGWLMLAGMMARPRAISSRTNSGVISIGNGGAEAVAVGQRAAAQIFARGDEFHFLGDEALARIMKLGDIRPGLARSSLTPCAVELRHRQHFAALQAIIFGLAGAAVIFLDIAARQNPVAAAGGQALFDVDGHGIVRVRTGCVVEPHRRLAARQRHFAERHAVRPSACASRAARRA